MYQNGRQVWHSGTLIVYLLVFACILSVGYARAKQPSLKSVTSEDHTVPVTALLKSATGMAHQTLP